MKKFLFLFNLLLLISWMGLIFAFSNDDGNDSSKKSDRLIIKIFETVKKRELSFKEKEQIIKKYSKPIRKLAHMFLYFVLSILSYFLLYQLYGLKPVTIIYTIIFCFIYAITDEIHQLFINNRSGQTLDIIIDTCGSILFLIIPTIILIKRKIVTNK